MPTNKRSTGKLSRRDFLKVGAVAGGSAIMAACAPGGGGGGTAGDLPDLTSGNSIPLDDLIAAAQDRGSADHHCPAA
jgi:hypothetical protein